MARPTKLTAAVSDTICAAVENGAAFETACEAAGIAAGTGWEWLARGMGRDDTSANAGGYQRSGDGLVGRSCPGRDRDRDQHGHQRHAQYHDQ